MSTAEPPDREELLETLRILERDPAGNTSARRRMHTWLAEAVDPAPEPHLELHALRMLAKRRQQEGVDFQVPEHLLECRVCMELFQVLCGQNESRTPLTSREGGAISAGKTRRPGRLSRARPKVRGLIAFAVVLLLSLFLWTLMQPPGIILESGALQRSSEILRAGRLPARRSLEALQRTELSFLDGSRITLEPGARIRIGKTLRFVTFIDLESGEALAEFLDARSAPEIRSDTLRILPANAAFHLNASAETLTLSVRRGTLTIRQPDGERTLSEGESLTPDKSADTGSEQRA